MKIQNTHAGSGSWRNKVFDNILQNVLNTIICPVSSLDVLHHFDCETKISHKRTYQILGFEGGKGGSRELHEKLVVAEWTTNIHHPQSME